MKISFGHVLSVAAMSLLLVACQAQEAQEGDAKPQTQAPAAPTQDTHDHDHEHGHDEAAAKIYKGFFEDDQVQDRPLSDWAGDWQSIYPYLQDGTLDEVFTHKAKEGDKTAEAYKEYYEEGYETDVERIVIQGENVTFFRKGEEISGTYTYDGHEILTYEAGNKGVRYIFKTTDAELPTFIQFSDHGISPNPSKHFHLFFGDDRQALLDEVTHWPTYFPSSLDGQAIAHEMIAH